MPTFTSTVPRFRITFILGTTNTITLTDPIANYSAYGTPTTAVFQVTDPDGLLIYQNTGFSSDPPSHVAPDFSSATGTWTKTGITPYLDVDGVTIKRGTYTVTAVYKNNTTAVTIVKSYDLQFVSPVVEITMSADCRTSELTSTDLTDYSIVGETEPITTTISRVHTITKPSGSSANDPGATTTTTITDTRTIGGGITAATRLWTRIWQTNIATTLQYDMELWDLYTWVVVQDVVYGDDSIDVQCSDCACVLNTCWENLIIRWKESEANHAINVNDLRYKIALGAALWTDFYNLERCGEDTTYKCIEIRDLLNSTDCSCLGDDDTKSHAITPWGASSGSVAASTFAFTFSSSNPTPGSGASGDVKFQTTSQHLWQNSSGTWVDYGSLSGADGAAGENAIPNSIFYNNSSNTGTSAGTTLELLDHIDLASPILYTTGDSIYAKAVFDLALNDNGKTCSIYLNATDIANHFTDSAVNATNNIVTIELWINVTGSDTQVIETLVTRGGNCYPGYVTGTFDTSGGIAINVYGQNSIATLNDIICRLLKVEYKNQISLA